MNLFEGQYNFQDELDRAGSREDAKKEAEKKRELGGQAGAENLKEEEPILDPAAKLAAYEKKVFPESNSEARQKLAEEWGNKIIQEAEKKKNPEDKKEMTDEAEKNIPVEKDNLDEPDDPRDEYYGRFNRIREGELLRKKQEETARLKQKNYKPFPKYKK